MTTNPDNIVRVRARNGGRASVYEANGWCQAYGSGILDGTGVVQNTSADMHVLVGGSSAKPDVLIAENPSGYKIALDVVGQQAITLTAPASNSRISAIVAYTDDLALESTEDTVTGSPASCGLIVVNGTAASNPSAPTDTQIRNAITADGATGSQASYAVIATIKVASSTTTITNSLITRNQAGVHSSKIDFSTLAFGNYSTSEVATGFTWIDGSPIYKKSIYVSSLGNNTAISTPHNISNLERVVEINAVMENAGGDGYWPIPYAGADNMGISGTSVTIRSNMDLTSYHAYVTLYYTKSS